ncbi:MAG: hypothetical protein QOE72_3309 [Chloroflexota bacterium]|jgi:hypothetical protein|nr:hypothetical protein [Chloroflexota bacterium]
MAEINRLRQALADARDEERRWAYERSKAERNSAEWDRCQQKCKEAHNRVRSLEDQIDRLR